MTWLLESPWPALTLGVVCELILAIVLVRSGRAVVLVAMAVVLAVTLGMLALERMVVTQTEEIENALHAAEAALETNDPTAVLALFTETSPRRSQVESALKRFHVRDAHIGRDLEIAPNALTNPPSARAFFTGRVEGADARGEVPYEQMLQKFTVTLHHEGDRWLIYDFTMEEPFSRRR